MVHKPWFSFGEIVVEGSEEINREEVIKIAGLKTPINLFIVDCARLKEALNMDLRIENAQTGYVWPNILRVTITDRKAAAYVACAYGGFVKVDYNGYVTKVSKGVRDSKVPIISGISAGNVYIGDQVVNEHILNIVKFLGQLDSTLSNSIAEISVDANGNGKILLTKGLPIFVGNVNNMQAKVYDFITICNEIQTRNISAEYIDLTFSKPYIKVKSIPTN